MMWHELSISPIIPSSTIRFMFVCWNKFSHWFPLCSLLLFVLRFTRILFLSLSYNRHSWFTRRCEREHSNYIQPNPKVLYTSYLLIYLGPTHAMNKQYNDLCYIFILTKIGSAKRRKKSEKLPNDHVARWRVANRPFSAFIHSCKYTMFTLLFLISSINPNVTCLRSVHCTRRHIYTHVTHCLEELEAQNQEIDHKTRVFSEPNPIFHTGFAFPFLFLFIDRLFDINILYI